MAEQPPEFVGLSRRTLLASAAAMSAASIAPFAKPSEASARAPKNSALAFEYFATPSTAMAKRLAEIARRNELRREVGLPLLSIPRELRRMKTAEADADFARFSEAFRSRVAEETLGQIREQLGQPDWKPQGMLSGGGMAFEAEVSRKLKRIYGRVTQLVHR